MEEIEEVEDILQSLQKQMNMVSEELQQKDVEVRDLNEDIALLNSKNHKLETIVRSNKSETPKNGKTPTIFKELAIH
jgi:chromosome segregation ATPase